jgi:pimeloyl-ACP methyl ester carboxylesterase
VAAFLDALGIEAAVLVGHSMGASVAQRFAIDFPERTLALVIVGAFAGFSANPAIIEFAEAVSALSDPIDPDFVREFQESTLAQPVPPAFLRMVVEESLKVPARVWRLAAQGFIEAEFPEELSKIEAPTLIVWGDQDAFVPRDDQDRLAAAIGDSRLSVYRGAGHATQWEEPARFAAEVAAFVEFVVG